jgi:prepilin-type N-terminal cleavage/methylation domain-containing protein
MSKVKLVRREQGFTLIELLIVSIIVGILGTLVAMTYSGVQAKNRNSDRQAEINTLQSELETYYAQANQYPSIKQLNDATWRNTNLKELSEDDLTDPQWDKGTKGCITNSKPAAAQVPTEKCYSYQATTTDGSTCNDVDIPCAQYTLTAVLEGGEKYVKTSLN